MSMFNYIGDGLLFLIALPILAFQCLEMLNAVMNFFAEVSTYIHYK
jgi:hypothetical protein